MFSDGGELPGDVAHKHALSRRNGHVSKDETSRPCRYEHISSPRSAASSRRRSGELARILSPSGLDKWRYLSGRGRDCYARGAPRQGRTARQGRPSPTTGTFGPEAGPSRRRSSSSYSPWSIKMSQAVAGEMCRRADQPADVIASSMPADRGLLLLPCGHRYRIEAGATSGSHGVGSILVETPATPSELPC